MAVIQRCRTCGFDVPSDVERCPGCEAAAPPSRAAHQVAGLALPTRSVHRLRHVAPRPEPVPRLGRARAARSAFSFTTALVVVTFAVASLTWRASRPRFVLTIPDGTVDFLDRLTTMAATAAVAAFSIGVVAMLAWTVRAGSRALRSAVSRLGD